MKSSSGVDFSAFNGMSGSSGSLIAPDGSKNQIKALNKVATGFITVCSWRVYKTPLDKKSTDPFFRVGSQKFYANCKDTNDFLCRVRRQSFLEDSIEWMLIKSEDKQKITAKRFAELGIDLSPCYARIKGFNVFLQDSYEDVICSFPVSDPPRSARYFDFLEEKHPETEKIWLEAVIDLNLFVETSDEPLRYSSVQPFVRAIEIWGHQLNGMNKSDIVSKLSRATGRSKPSVGGTLANLQKNGLALKDGESWIFKIPEILNFYGFRPLSDSVRQNFRDRAFSYKDESHQVKDKTHRLGELYQSDRLP